MLASIAADEADKRGMTPVNALNAWIAESGSAFGIMSRRCGDVRPSPWFGGGLTFEGYEALALLSADRTLRLVRASNLATSFDVARYSPVAPVLDVLAGHEWREVRMGVVQNRNTTRALLRRIAADDPAVGLRLAAEARLARGTEVVGPRLCVECGGRVKSDSFLTCCVACSVAQFERRCRTGRWSPSTAEDFRFQHGLRAAWPEDFQWSVAYRAKFGTVPGTGPRRTNVLVSFVAGVTAPELCAELRRGVEAGVAADHLVRVLHRLAPNLDDRRDVRAAVRTVVRAERRTMPTAQAKAARR